ncbi:putative GCN5-related N-acetyltransferase [Acidobacteriia bacterium SbA2]|nr:putative GCN5-related N-acetyltransferase [Acidobacteriia bacterium SbA2]
MIMQSTNFLLKKEPVEVAPYLEEVKRRADAEALSLGFFPSEVYTQSAERERLVVAVHRSEERDTFAGHLLFGGTFPHLRVFQIYVEEQFRRRGVASMLLDDLILEGEQGNFLTISARVADDLEGANKFWARRGFDALKVVPGGGPLPRVINIRVRQLSTPTLFSAAGFGGAGVAADLQLAGMVPSRSPVFSLDVNVILDIAQRRPRCADVQRIMSAAMNNELRLVVADEFVAELERSHQTGKPDPLLELARGLPRFSKVPVVSAAALSLRIESVVFSQKKLRVGLKPRDKSDISHLVAAIHNRVNGFVTSEDRILKQAKIFRSQFGIDILSPADLSGMVESDPLLENAEMNASFSGIELTVSEISESLRIPIEQFIRKHVSDESVDPDLYLSGTVSSHRRRLVAATDQQIVGCAAWESPQQIRPAQLSLLVDDSQTGSRVAADYLLDLAIRDSCKRAPALIHLSGLGVGKTGLEMAVARGFRRAHGSSTWCEESLVKISFGQVISEDTLATARSRLMELAHVGLPPQLPPYCGFDTGLRVCTPTGAEIAVPLAMLEDLLSPTLLVLPGRPCALVPIRPGYARELLDTGRQLPLFPRKTASLFSERVYYSSSRTASVLVPGALIIFYESSDRGKPGAVTACGRVVRSMVESRIPPGSQSRGVLMESDLPQVMKAGPVNVTFFDTVLRFKSPVALDELRTLGCCKGGDLVLDFINTPTYIVA